MKSLSLVALGAFCLSTSAIAAEPDAITVRASDPFAAAAIRNGDYARAEALLNARHFDRNDPVRLINLGAVGARRVEIAVVAEHVVDAAGGDAGGRRAGQAVRRIAAIDMLLVEQVPAPEGDRHPLSARAHRNIGERDPAVEDQR